MKKLIALFLLLLTQESFGRIESLPHCTAPMAEFDFIQSCTYKLQDDLYISLVRDTHYVAHFGLENHSVLTQSFFESFRQADQFHDESEEWIINQYTHKRIMEGFPKDPARLRLPPLRSPTSGKEDSFRMPESTPGK